MIKQGWSTGLDAQFLTIGNFDERVGDLRTGGGERLARDIEYYGYRLVVIDTFSRAVGGDQSDVSDMTEWLTPIQEIAHQQGAVVMMVDHHRKSSAMNPDAIEDILGSTAKGAVSDTIMGLYRERGKVDANLSITGREIEERRLSLHFDAKTGCWQFQGESNDLEK